MPLAYESGDLSVHIVPEHYKLTLTPRGSQCIGRAEISLTIEPSFTGHVIPIHASPTVAISKASLVHLESGERVRLPINDPVEVLHNKALTKRFLSCPSPVRNG